MRRCMKRSPTCGVAARGLAGGRHPAQRARQGFTLLEILLVLALMVAMAAMVIPALFVFDDEYLRQAADQVRGDWSAARVEAMTSGLTQVFRYEIESGEYVIQPWEGDDALLEASGGTSSSGGVTQGNFSGDTTGFGARSGGLGPVAPGGAGVAGSPYNNPQNRAGSYTAGSAVHQKTLPEEIKFASGQVGMDIRAVQVADAVGSSYLAPPILFYPDGTTSDAIVTLVNDQGDTITLQLRGLTGIVQVSEIEHHQGLLPTGPNPGGLPGGGTR